MKTNKLFIGLASLVAAVGFTACSNDDAGYQQSLSRGNVISLTSQLQTMRSTTDPQAGTSLAEGLNVGVFGVSSEGTSTMTNYTNNEYVTAANNAIGIASGGSEMTWPTTSGATASIYAYAPYQDGWTVDAANTFSVQADQSTSANYLASDLIYAKAETQAQNTTVALPFKHMLSKMNITITRAENATIDLSSATVTITNTKLKAALTPNGGDNVLSTVDSDNDAADITVIDGSSATLAETGGNAYAIIIPQTVSAGTELVKIVSGTKTLIAKLGTNTTFTSGNAYSFTVNVGDIPEGTSVVTVVLGTTSVTQWTTDDNTLGAVSFPRWYSTFSATANSYTWDSATNAFGWKANNNNIMTCFTFDKGELANYKSVVFSISGYTSGNEYRVGYYIGNQFSVFNKKTYGTSGAMYSGGIKVVDLEALMTQHAKSLSDVTKIGIGGGSNSGSVTINYFYLSTLSAAEEKSATGGSIISMD